MSSDTNEFLSLVFSDLYAVRDAVANTFTPAEALNALGVYSNSNRTVHLADLIRFYRWDTSHWKIPVTGEAVYHWNHLTIDTFHGGRNSNEVGERFERRVNKEIIALIRQSETPVRYFKESEVQEFANEIRDDLLPTRHGTLAPWDGVVWFPDQRKIVFIEAKASNNQSLRRKVRKQVEYRLEEVQHLRSKGYTVTMLAVIGTAAEAPWKHRVELLHDNGGWSGGLAEMTFKHLKSKNPAWMITEPVDQWIIPFPH